MRGIRFVRSTRIAAAGAVFVAAAVALGSPTAAAAPVCPGAGQAPVLVGRAPGAVIEGAIVDGLGRLYLTDLSSGRVLRMDHPGATAVPIATVPAAMSGGLAWAPDGGLLVGYGDARVVVGDLARSAGIVKVDVTSGAVHPFAVGLSAANGLAVARDGTVYATNDFASLVGRVLPNGVVQPDWAVLPSANGAALSADDRYLYVSRTFTNPGVSRIPTANPGAPESLVTFGGGDVFAAPDGLVLDAHGRPIVPTDISGQILRVDGPNQFCVLASGLPVSSVLTYGAGTSGFSAGRLFRAGFDGSVYEI
ncbi:SMP-30/gluconolactonase/LRE family protein [Rhodococcus spelaei]|uniref:SMP-30/gluconolactonase/LRE family protein n=1 Tax=Rhodococcus spelaei TaxID=2546320 RepID=A0A541AZN1_9NOCA|nr:SMP-30/gluconolactonase/LRE family protein [Rhodococcus spelaei]TQF65525.1 SMP-30/gluconolactonase/LRE family protein [Rhodococcus spelaei]